MTFGTWLFTKMRGELVGTDAEGNRYYQDKRMIAGRRRKRWVMYNGVVEASRVPPDWHGWLHYTTDALAAGRRPAAQDLAEGSSAATSAAPTIAYRPPGSTLVQSATSPSRLTRRGVRAEMRQR